MTLLIKLNKPVIVEGKYDKIKLSAIIDAPIITTDGFKIFKDEEKCTLIKSLAQSVGIIVITDSDVAGFKIRNFIKSITKNENVTHIYIPQIEGKEKRKLKPSSEGTLGVEGLNIDLLKSLLISQNVLFEEGENKQNMIMKLDFYEAGFIGKDNSAKKREMLLAHLNLPSYMSANALLSVINIFMSYDEFEQYVINSEQE